MSTWPPPSGTPLADPPRRRRWMRRVAPLAVVAIGVSAAVASAVFRDDTTDGPNAAVTSVSAGTSDLDAATDDGPTVDDQPVADVDDAAPPTTRTPAAAPTPPSTTPVPSTTAPASETSTDDADDTTDGDTASDDDTDDDTADDADTDADAADTSDGDSSVEADLADIQAGADKLADADEDDVLVLSLPAGGPAEPGALQPLTATIRGDNVYLEGTAPSSAVGLDYEVQAREIWGDQVVARYSIDSRAPVPLADDVVLEKPVLFEPGSAVIDPEYMPVLDACFEFLTTYPSVTMIVEGHTDDVGSDEYNLRLAEQRAAAIVAYYESLGLPPDRLVTVAAGESDPLADNATDDGREQNRRIDLSLIGALTATADDDG